MNSNVYTVSQINRYIKGSFDMDPLLKRVMVKGEVRTEEGLTRISGIGT